MAIPAINVLGNPNVTEGNFQIAIEDLRKSVIGSGKAYDAANTYSQYDSCVYGGIVYYSKINSNTGNTPAVGTNWGLIGDLITGVVHNVGNESIDGTKTFTTSPVVPTPTTTGNVITMGNILEKTPVAIGYGVGSGGTVTQLTSKSTAVTLNKPTGTIITSNSALLSSQGTSFAFLNSLLSINDNLKLTPKGSINYDIDVIDIYNGAAVIRIINKDSISHSDAISINFSVEKGANS